MSKFLKNFAFGLLYFLLLPLELAAIVVFGIYALAIDIVIFFKGTLRFFKGKPFFEPFPEDEKVLEIRKAQVDLMAHPNGVPAAPAPAAPAGPSTVYVQQNYYTGTKPADGQPTPTQLPPNAPIDANGYFTPSQNQIPLDQNGKPIDMASQQTPGIPIHHLDDMAKERPEIARDPKLDTKTVAIIDLSKMDDGKDDE